MQTTDATVEELRQLRDRYNQEEDAEKRDEILAALWDTLARL